MGPDRKPTARDQANDRSPPGTDIMWETTITSSPEAPSRDGRTVTFLPSVEAARFHTGTRSNTRFVTRPVRRVAAILTNPTFIQLHGRSPMETSRIAATTVADAAEVLGRSDDVEWGRGRDAGHLLLGSFRVAAKELGQPRVADGVLHGHGFRRLRVTVAIYKYGRERCSIQIRPRYRRPRTTRRLRHCLQSTHGAADRLRELVLTVDFMPPHRSATGG